MIRANGCRGPRPTAHRRRLQPGARATWGLLASACFAIAACDRAAEIELEEGARRAAVLEAGEVHSYGLCSPDDRVVEVVIEQRGVDVAVSVLDAAGSPRTTVDRFDATEGDERLFLLVEAGVGYRLEVRGYGGAGGPYELVVERVRPAGPEDRRRAIAQVALARAQALSGGGGRDAWQEAADRYREALAIFRELGDSRGQAQTQQDLGRLYRKLLEDPRVAIHHYRAALAGYRALGDERSASVVLNNLGRLRFELGELGAAFELYLRALEIDRRLGDREGEVAALANLAQVARYRGDVQEALSHYDAAIDRLSAGVDPAGSGGLGPLYLGRLLNNRGRLYQALGDLDQALEDLERALTVSERVATERQRRELQAIVLSGLGSIRHQRGEVPAAVADLERALAMRRQLDASHGRAVTLLALGRAHADLGREQEALEGYRRALALFRELESPRGEARALLAIADAVERRGEAAEALRGADEARDLFRSLGDRAGEIDAMLAGARAERGLSRYRTALLTAEQALAKAEELRREAAVPELRATYFAALRDQFDLLVEMLLARHRQEPGAGFDRAALEASERFRARSLIDLLGDRRDAALDRADPELFGRVEDLEDRIRVLGRDRELVSDADLAGVESRLREVVRRRESLIGRIRGPIEPSPGPPETLGADQIQDLLEPGTALLEYHLGAGRSRLWVVTADSFEVFELAPRHEIERAARELHEVIGYGPRWQYEGATERALEAVARLVLEPAAGALAADRLLIAADGALHYVPFAALPLPPVTGVSERLVDRHEVLRVPSASALAALRRELAGRPRPPGRIAVIGDPVFTADDPRAPSRVNGIEADTEPGSPLGPAEASSREPSLGRRLRRLTFAGEEARSVLSRAPPELRLAALGLDATREQAIAPELRGFAIVHYATHAFIDPVRPELSHLVFSQIDREGRRRDGSLYAFELPRLELAADLVVLSGCGTALGREIRGEGLVGLTQGFFDAGAAQVLVSLWPVDDRATAELMSRFYGGLLGDGLATAAALRAAQRSLLRTEGWEAPYFWAGFVLQGEGPAGRR